MEQDVEVECGLTMGIRALTITVQLECDDYSDILGIYPVAAGAS